MTWLTVKQAAKQLQVSPGTVRTMIESGRLKATLVGSGVQRKTYRIPAESLQQISEIEVKVKDEKPRMVSRDLHPALAKAMGL